MKNINQQPDKIIPTFRYRKNGLLFISPIQQSYIFSPYLIHLINTKIKLLHIEKFIENVDNLDNLDDINLMNQKDEEEWILI